MIEKKDILNYYNFYHNVYRNSHSIVTAQLVDIFEKILIYRSYAKYTWITPQSRRDHSKV